jgi:tetratricopeptide (TPR) repeat protein
MKTCRNLVVIPLLILCAACASQKALDAFNEAKEYEGAGLFVEAAEQDLRALRERPDFKDALLHLKEVAPKAYEELVDRGEKLSASGNVDQAVAEFQRLENLLRACHAHGVVFETANINDMLARAQQLAAQHHYARADSFFSAKQWRPAAGAFLKAHEYRSNYNGALDKAIQAYINSGENQLSEKNYSAAAEDFGDVLQLAPSHSLAKSKAAESHYLLGEQLFSEGRYREALSRFEKVYDFVDDYRDVANWVERAYEAATQHVAIFPFVNRSSINVDPYFFAGEILNQVYGVSLDFVEFLPYADMVAALDDFHLNAVVRLHESELLRVASSEGLESFVWGQIRSIEVRDSPEEFKELRHELATGVKDSSGKAETRTIYYREYTASRFVRIVIDCSIFHGETGAQLDRQTFVDDVTDEARWIGYQGSIYDLPENQRSLLDASRDPRPVAVLVDQLSFSLTEDIAKYIIKFYR